MKPEIATGIIKRKLKSEPEVRIKIQGSCMEPFILDNQVAIVKSCDLGDLKIGDIVLLFALDSLRIHRIVHVDYQKTIFYTKGDNALSYDPLLYNTEIIGAVSEIEGSNININNNGRLIKVIAYFSWKEGYYFNKLQRKNSSNYKLFMKMHKLIKSYFVNLYVKKNISLYSKGVDKCS